MTNETFEEFSNRVRKNIARFPHRCHRPYNRLHGQTYSDDRESEGTKNKVFAFLHSFRNGFALISQ